MKPLREQLEIDEGNRPLPYMDSLGFWTVGIGRMIDSRKGGGLSPDEIDFLLLNPKRQPCNSIRYAYQDSHAFWAVPLSHDETELLIQNDIESHRADCYTLFPDFDNFTQVQQDAITNIIFNMGAEKFGTFHRTIAAINAGDWAGACEGLNNSLWHKQVGIRADRIIAALEP